MTDLCKLRDRTELYAMRFRLSVALRVNIISRGDAATMNFRTASRAFSYVSVARTLRS